MFSVGSILRNLFSLGIPFPETLEMGKTGTKNCSLLEENIKTSCSLLITIGAQPGFREKKISLILLVYSSKTFQQLFLLMLLHVSDYQTKRLLQSMDNPNHLLDLFS